MKILPLLAVSILLPLLSVGAEQLPDLTPFTPAKGFKPAQRNLTEIFLQLAGSLECYGSPEPYLRHVASEHARIEALYRKKSGRAPKSYRPDHMTDAYIDKLAANWRLLAPKLGLDAFAKEIGDDMREAIKGTRGTGTIVVDILNRHQSRVFNQMSGKSQDQADFEALRAELQGRLEIGRKNVSEQGYEVARRDAVSYAQIMHGLTVKLFGRIDEALKPDAAKAVKDVLMSVFMDTGMMAHSELQLGIAEWALPDPAISKR